MNALQAEGWVLLAEPARELMEEHGAAHLRSVLIDTDLKEVGAPCLPLRQRKTGTLVLQVTSIDNIGESRGRDHGKRMLKVLLTDGHTCVTCIEYKAVTSLSTDIPPGTKVLLKDARVQNGFVLLDEHCIKVLGGHVPVLYEGWEIQRKYSGSARKFLKSSSKDVVHEAPLFHGLKPGAQTSTVMASNDPKPLQQQQQQPSTSSSREPDGRVHALRAAVEMNPEAGPAQNHAAAQKLLNRKTDDSSPGHRRGRGGRGGGRRRYEAEEAVLTLEEWEARKSGASTSTAKRQDVSGDEEFARKLQQQLDMGQEVSEAERIRQSMFNFGADTRSNDDNERGRGRGRGRRGRRH